ncbi:MAG TPA: hypothetical protein VFS16_14755 [Acidimicrobiia bacterium]|nr:hypothetical protein [Acidimicrobiia bacterium]
MPIPSPADLLVLIMFVLLVLDSRRLRSLASGRCRRDVAGTGIPAGSASDQVGLTLGRIQLREFVDGSDGGARWPDLEVLCDDDDHDDAGSVPVEPPSLEGWAALLPISVGRLGTLPPPQHCPPRPTGVLDWCLPNDLVRRPVAVLERAEHRLGTSGPRT